MKLTVNVRKIAPKDFTSRSLLYTQQVLVAALVMKFDEYNEAMDSAAVRKTLAFFWAAEP